MRSSHPMYFAKKIVEVASDDPIDFMEQQPTGIAIQGLLRPAFIEEQSVIQKYRLSHTKNNSDSKDLKAKEDKVEDVGEINGHGHMSASSEDNSVSDEDSERENGLAKKTAFYKLEMVKIQLISALGNQASIQISTLKDLKI